MIATLAGVGASSPKKHNDGGPFASRHDGADPDDAHLGTILKYKDPVLARPRTGFDMGLGHDSLPQYISLYAPSSRPSTTNARTRSTGVANARGGRRRLHTHTGEDNTATLKDIIPNKEWTDEAGDWVQTVSSVQWARSELDALQGKIDAKLTSLQARPSAVCAVRQQIFSELYDEVIRQMTLECPERGLLLLRLRDETRMNLDTYCEIYRDSVVFSRRRAEGARQELCGLQLSLKEIQAENSGLEASVRSLESQLAAVDRSNSYARAMTDQHHAEKLQVAKAEQKALETAIAKSQKKFREADTTGQPQETEETGLSDTGQSKG